MEAMDVKRYRWQISAFGLPYIEESAEGEWVFTPRPSPAPESLRVECVDDWLAHHTLSESPLHGIVACEPQEITQLIAVEIAAERVRIVQQLAHFAFFEGECNVVTLEDALGVAAGTRGVAAGES